MDRRATRSATHELLGRGLLVGQIVAGSLVVFAEQVELK
jgi:hypothetical protein